MEETSKMDLIRNKIQENNFRSADFNFALVEEDNIWRVLLSKIIFSKKPKRKDETCIRKENFALECFSLSITEFEDFLQYLEKVHVGNVLKSGNEFQMNDDLFYRFGNYKLSFVGNFPSRELCFCGRQTMEKFHGINKASFTFEYSIHANFSAGSHPTIDFTDHEVPLRNIYEAINYFWKTQYQQHSISSHSMFYFPVEDANIEACEVLDKKINIKFDNLHDADEVTLSVIASNNTNGLEFRKKFSISANYFSADVGFVPTSVHFYLNRKNEKLDEYIHYAPSENEEGFTFGENKPKTTITNTRNIVLFVGAGTSIQFGIPATKEFKEYLLENDTAGTELLKSILIQDEFPDIEHVLSCIMDLMKISKTHAGIYLGKRENNIQTSQFPPLHVSDVLGQAEGLYHWILQRLFDKYQIQSTYHREVSGFFGKLFSILKQHSARIDIGTTNYDLAIETFCNLNASAYICIDGFTMAGTDFVWNPNRFEEYVKKSSEFSIPLYKIHGSLNWAYAGSQIRKTEKIEYQPSKKNPHNVIVAPTVSPKDASNIEPYVSVFNRFSERLANADVCIAIGTSFRDDITAKKFVDFLDQGKHLIIISPSCYQNYTRNLFKQTSVPELSCAEWARHASMEKNGRVTFIDLPASRETNEQLFARLQNALLKN